LGNKSPHRKKSTRSAAKRAKNRWRLPATATTAIYTPRAERENNKQKLSGTSISPSANPALLARLDFSATNDLKDYYLLHYKGREREIKPQRVN
jgi:hypothetical protein